MFSACNYWQDFNGDGLMDDKELVGVKDTFSLHERVTFIAKFFNQKGAKGRVRFYSPDGKVALETDFDVTLDNHVSMMEINSSAKTPGTWACTWYIDGTHVGTTQITISGS